MKGGAERSKVNARIQRTLHGIEGAIGSFVLNPMPFGRLGLGTSPGEFGNMGMSSCADELRSPCEALVTCGDASWRVRGLWATTRSSWACLLPAFGRTQRSRSEFPGVFEALCRCSGWHVFTSCELKLSVRPTVSTSPSASFCESFSSLDSSPQ